MTLIAGIGFVLFVLFLGAMVWPYEPDHYTGKLLVCRWNSRIVDGRRVYPANGRIYPAQIVEYNPRTKVATTTGWTTAPDTSATFELRGNR